MYVAGDVRLAGVRRLLCKGCGHTISLLPSFLHRCRHYALAVIREVVEERVEQPRPWAAPLARPFACTKRRWVKALAITTWLAWLLQTLAEVQPGAPELDAHGSTPTLFGLLRCVASWLEPRTAAWHVVWRTGWNAGVGRLV